MSEGSLGDAEVLRRKAGVCEAALPFLEATLDEMRKAAAAVLSECQGDSMVGRSACNLLYTIASLELAFSQAEGYVQELTNAPARMVEEAVGSGQLY